MREHYKAVTEPYKAAFFGLTENNQRSLRLFMALTSVNGCVGFLLEWSALTYWGIPGVALNLALLFWSIVIKKAPLYYFCIITITFWMVLIFNGLVVVDVLGLPDSLGPNSIVDILGLLLVAIFGRVVLSYRKEVKSFKSPVTTDITEARG